MALDYPGHRSRQSDKLHIMERNGPLSRLLLFPAIIALLAVSVSVAQAQTPTIPTVSTIAVTSNPGTDNTYTTLDVITVTVTFSEAVTVAGTPRITLDIGGTEQTVDYSGAGSGTGQLLFNYEVRPVDQDDDGIAVAADSLALNGGTIRSTDDSTDATLAHAAQSAANHKVDTKIVLVSNMEQADATDTITISATDRVKWELKGDAAGLARLTDLAVDVVTPSDTLTVTLRIERILHGVTTYTDFSGSVSSAGRQVFRPVGGSRHLQFEETSRIRKEIHILHIIGSGAGHVELGSTTSAVKDDSGLFGWFFDLLISISTDGGSTYVGQNSLLTSVNFPRLAAIGHYDAVLRIESVTFISKPFNGTTYAAGEAIEVIIELNRTARFPDHDLSIDLALGGNPGDRHSASLVDHVIVSIYAKGMLFAYRVQPGDEASGGVSVVENPLGVAANAIDLLGPAIAVDLAFPETAGGVSHAVDGSGSWECNEIHCAYMTAGEYPARPGSRNVGYDFNGLPSAGDPEISSSTFVYRERTFHVFVLARETRISGPEYDPTLFLQVVHLGTPPPSEILKGRLGIEHGGATFPFADARESYAYAFDIDVLQSRIRGKLPTEAYLWTDDSTWSVGDRILIKIVEMPVTATFDAATYAEDEGGSFEVNVTLGGAFEGKTVTLPLTATGAGGATSADFSGVPSELVFVPGETEKTFTVELTDDDVDDDDESVTLSFGTLPRTVKTGGDHETATVAIRDDDDPEVDVEFGAATYSADEGGTATVAVTLTADPERTVIIPLTTTGQGGVSTADYSGVPTSVTFNTGETSKTFTFTAAQDEVDDDDESVKLTFGTLPDRVSEGTEDETTVNIGDDDDPEVEVEFGAATYSADEGGTVTVTVTLSADPERTITILLIKTEQGGVASDDYSGIPASVTFNTGETSKTFTFSATQDEVDDDDEGVKLTFETLTDRVSEGAQDETTVSIDDDDDPFVSVSYEHTEYQVFEGGSVTLALVLSVDPERTVIIPLTAAGQSGATSIDYSAPASVTFNSGETRKTFRFTATEDTVQEDSESVRLGFASDLPSRVDPGSPSETTVAIGDCEGGGIWCASLELSLIYSGDHGRTRLRRADLDYDQFLYNGVTYGVGGVRVYSYEQRLPVTPPFAIPERASISLDLSNLNGTGFDRYQVPNEDYLDWTLHISTTSNGDTLTAELPFSEAKKFGTPIWRWYGLDIDKLRLAWTTGKVYKLRIVEDFRSERTARVLGPPLYLRVQEEYSNSKYLRLRWVAPQMRDDYLPPEVSYKIQWKESTGSWDTAADVSEATRGASTKHSVTYRLGGLTAGVEYNIRIIATNSVGDSEPSNEITYTKPGEGQPHAVNSPATGGPGIDGFLRAGETLTATTTGIQDEDGMSGAVFAYQWIRRDLATVTDTDIAGTTGSTYTVTTEDEGKGLMVRVTFTDDAGNEESLTSFAVIISPPLVIPDDEPANTPATGAPGIDGSPVVGQTLTATTSDIGDDDGIVDAAFAYQWLADDAAIEGASASTYTVAAGDVGKTIKVRVTFTDDVGNEESLTSAPTAAVTQPLLTAAIHDAPESHDGRRKFTFELRFSEEFSISFRTLRDHAFTVTGGEVTKARRLERGKNIRWEIHVRPNSNAGVTIVLPVTTDCDARGAVCTEDGRMLSGRLELTVSGPGG